jgi:hypothetical protein
MFSNKAWQRHGCYRLGSDQYFNIPLDKAVLGCMDDWNSLDHFDPTADSRRMFAHFLYLRTVYSSLQDGFNLVQRGNWTISSNAQVRTIRKRKWAYGQYRVLEYLLYRTSLGTTRVRSGCFTQMRTPRKTINSIASPPVDFVSICVQHHCAKPRVPL